MLGPEGLGSNHRPDTTTWPGVKGHDRTLLSELLGEINELMFRECLEQHLVQTEHIINVSHDTVVGTRRNG